MVRRIQRWYRRQKGTYLPRHYHKNQIPILDGPRLLQKVESRMQAAETERSDDLPSRWDIPARQGAAHHARIFERLSQRDQESDEGIRQLILSSEEIQRDLQTRRALYAYLRYKRRQYYWEALRDDVYALSLIHI